MTHYKHEAKQAAHDKMKRMGLNKEHSAKKHFDDVHPYDGVPQLNTDTPSGLAPISKQRFKRGGKVAHLEGNRAKQNLGKASRSKAPIPYERDEELKSGGVAAFNPLLRKKRAAAMAMRKKREGLPYGAPSAPGMNPGMTYGTSIPSGNIMPRKKGGSVSAHPDEAEDRKLIRKEVKPSALKNRAEKCWGGRTKKADGGGLRSERTQYEKARRNSVDQGMDLDTDSQHTQDTLRKAVRNFENTAKETGYSNLKRGGRAHKADGGEMRSESTQLAKARRNASDAYYDAYPNTFSGMAKNLTSPEKWLDQGSRLSETRRDLNQARQETGDYKKGGRAHKNGGGGLKLADQNDPYYGTIVDAAGNNTMPSSDSWRKKPDQPTILKPANKDDPWGSIEGYFSSKPKSTGGRAKRATGGKVGSGKGKTSINIIIAPEGQKGASQMPAGGPPAIPPQLLAAMAGGAGGPPPGAMPPGAGMAGAGGGLGAGPAMNVGRPGMTAPTPPMRKDGGRVGGKAPQAATPTHQEHDYGSGSGLGRLEKRKWPLAK